MPVETDPTMDEDGCRVRPGFPLSVSVSAGLAPLAGGQLPVTICHQVSALFVPAVEVWQPHVAQGARLMALLRGPCRDSNRHDRSCSWPSSPHLFSVYRALAGCERRVPRIAAAMPAGAICPVRTALVVRTVWAWSFERWSCCLGRCRAARHIAATGCTLAKG